MLENLSSMIDALFKLSPLFGVMAVWIVTLYKDKNNLIKTNKELQDTYESKLKLLQTEYKEELKLKDERYEAINEWARATNKENYVVLKSLELIIEKQQEIYSDTNDRIFEEIQKSNRSMRRRTTIIAKGLKLSNEMALEDEDI